MIPFDPIVGSRLAPLPIWEIFVPSEIYSDNFGSSAKEIF
jgi:hypothetical protein